MIDIEEEMRYSHPAFPLGGLLLVAPFDREIEQAHFHVLTTLPDRLTAGRLFLAQVIGVRVPVREP